MSFLSSEKWIYVEVSIDKYNTRKPKIDKYCDINPNIFKDSKTAK